MIEARAARPVWHTRAELAAVGKDAVSSKTRWRLPAGHPEAMPDQAQADERPDAVPALNSPGAVLVVVAGANNAGVSAVVETFGPRGGPPAVVRIPEQASRGTGAGQQGNSSGGNMSEQAQVDEALRGLRDMLATDGYELRWSVSSPGAVLVQVVAGEGACADCLVPRPLMEGILSDALGPTGYALDRVVLPADG